MTGWMSEDDEALATIAREFGLDEDTSSLDIAHEVRVQLEQLRLVESRAHEYLQNHPCEGDDATGMCSDERDLRAALGVSPDEDAA